MAASFGVAGHPAHVQRTVVVLLAATILAHASALAIAQSGDRFVGTWVEDQSKRTLGAERNLTFRQSASGGIEELRGSYARPLVQPVRFGAPAYPVDGSRNTIEWKQSSATQFERTISQNGQTLNVRRIAISADGKVLTEATEILVAGKKTTVTMVYRRTTNEAQGIVGVWKPESRKSDTPAVMRVEAAGTALKVTNNPDAVGTTTFTLAFDGKPVTVVGAAVISGTTTNGTRVDANTLRMAQAREGVATGTTTWTLSADGKTLTSRSSAIGPDATKEPTVIVFARR